MSRRFSWSAYIVPLLAAVTIAQVSAQSASPYLQRRQGPPQVSSPVPTTSSFNWWPYPSWGAETSSTTAIPVTLAQGITSSDNMLTNSNLLPDSSTPSPTISLPTLIATSSSTSTTSLVYITALPPATTPGRKFTRPTRGSFNVAYLAPLFAILGAALGILLTWLVFRLSRARHLRRRAGSFQPGPEYTPPLTGADGSGSGDGQRSQEAYGTDFLGGTRSHSRSMNEVTPRSNKIIRNSTVHQREAAMAARVEGPASIPLHTENESMSYLEDDPFLVPPSERDGHSIETHSPLDALFGAADVLSDEDEPNDALYDTMRHKSIRRGILERLKYGSRYRKGHKRADSDVDVEGLNTSKPDYAPVSTAADDTPIRGRSMDRKYTQSLTTSCDEASSGPGFRIVQEDTEADARKEAGGLLGLNWTLPWIASPDKLNAEDRFTMLPARRSIIDKRRSPSPAVPRRPSPSSLYDDKDIFPAARMHLPRVDSSVLPSSPPRIMSPPLDAQLFFGAIPSKFGSTPHLSFSIPDVGDGEHTSIPQIAESPTRKGSRPNKLRTQRSPPLLPFPSTGKRSPSRNRHIKSRHPTLVSKEHTSPLIIRHAFSPKKGLYQQHEGSSQVGGARAANGEGKAISSTIFDAANNPQSGIEQRLEEIQL